MRKYGLVRLVGCLFAVALTLGTSPLLAEASACVQVDNVYLCPPPHGGVETDINGNTVCGPGLCARGSNGLVKCSALPGGDVTIDMYGNVLCVGGCVDGRRAVCVEPKP